MLSLLIGLASLSGMLHSQGEIMGLKELVNNQEIALLQHPTISYHSDENGYSDIIVVKNDSEAQIKKDMKDFVDSLLKDPSTLNYLNDSEYLDEMYIKYGDSNDPTLKKKLSYDPNALINEKADILSKRMFDLLHKDDLAKQLSSGEILESKLKILFTDPSFFAKELLTSDPSENEHSDFHYEELHKVAFVQSLKNGTSVSSEFNTNKLELETLRNGLIENIRSDILSEIKSHKLASTQQKTTKIKLKA